MSESVWQRADDVKSESLPKAQRTSVGSDGVKDLPDRLTIFLSRTANLERLQPSVFGLGIRSRDSIAIRFQDATIAPFSPKIIHCAYACTANRGGRRMRIKVWSRLHEY